VRHQQLRHHTKMGIGLIRLTCHLGTFQSGRASDEKPLTWNVARRRLPDHGLDRQLSGSPAARRHLSPARRTEELPMPSHRDHLLTGSTEATRSSVVGGVLPRFTSRPPKPATVPYPWYTGSLLRTAGHRPSTDPVLGRADGCGVVTAPGPRAGSEAAVCRRIVWIAIDEPFLSWTQRCAKWAGTSALAAGLHRRASARAKRAARLSSNRPACWSSSSK
jgi:hypothetical protein